MLSCASTISGCTRRKLRLIKSDFKAAYRCYLISKAHSEYASLLVRHSTTGEVLEATQYAMPFRAVAAVYARDRLGEAVAHIVEHELVVAVGRYVDDLCMADYAETATELRSFLLELVSLLSLTLEESKSPEPSESLEILGVEVMLSHIATPTGKTLKASLTVGPANWQFWVSQIEDALSSGTISFRELEKLVGTFASSAAWGPLARGHLTSLHSLLSRGGGCIAIDSTMLARADLQWWMSWLLEARVIDVMSRGVDLPSAIMYYAQKDAVVGAVLAIGNDIECFGGRVSSLVISRLKPRKTQIFPLEVIAATSTIMKRGARAQGRKFAFLSITLRQGVRWHRGGVRSQT